MPTTDFCLDGKGMQCGVGNKSMVTKTRIVGIKQCDKEEEKLVR